MKKLAQAINRQMAWQEQMNSTAEVMYLAWVVELGELVESMGTADWKQQPRDEANMLVEAVDLLIFTVNLAYHHGEKIDLTVEHHRVANGDETELVFLLQTYLLDQNYSALVCVIVDYFPQAVDIMIAKQALNQLRQNYGYKTGDYIKQWQAGEDNMYLAALLGSDYNEVYEALEEIYTTKVAVGVLPLC